MISIIMSCYNSDKEQLKQSIESILNQTYTDFEFLIADNGEKFNLEEFLKQFNDPRIKYINNNGNIGPVASFNNLHKLAKGQYIALQDHDDISLPNRLQFEKEELDNNHKLQSVSCLIHIFGGKKEQDDGIAMESSQVKEELIFWQPIKQPTFMKRKEFADKYNYNEWFIYDYEFWSRTRHIPHKIINRVGLNYRKSASNSSIERKNNIRFDHCRIIQRNFNELGLTIPIELCQMLDPFCHKKFDKKYVDLFKSCKDVLLKEISEGLYNRKYSELCQKVM